ncbi:MAG TPA: flagellar hook-associated protein FlgK [Methylococcaceae bacterium]|nr:flagellar hook-associated protein FlgK [Methylococcaceae bacterium]
MTTGLLGIATSGLMAFQRNLATTGHNIANVNTEGYSRQKAELTERLPQFTGAGFMGNGVDVASITRSYDDFLNTQVRTSTSTYAGVDAYHRMATQIDNIIADQDTGLSPSLQAFFNAVQGVANDPTSIAARQVMITQGQTLTQTFKTLNGQMDDLRDQMNQGLSSSVDEINTLAGGIAAFNQQIVVSLGQGGGKQPPNDLLDQRNLLLEKLSQQIDTQVVAQDDGSLNVFIGKGQSLVMGATANTLKVQNSAYDSNQKDIALSAGGTGSVLITDSLSGGEIGGLLDFANRVLDPAQNALGRIAVGLATQFNTQHQLGSDLTGQPGVDFFAEPTVSYSGTIFPKSGSTGTVSVNYRDANQLQASDYRLDFDGTSTYTLTRLSDNQVVARNATGDFSGTNSVDGLDIQLTGASSTSSFLIRPTRAAADQIAMNLTDPRQIAAAATPYAGPGDNRNALALAALQTAPKLLNGKASYQDAYTAIVGDVGSLTHAAEINSTAQKNLLDNATQQRDSVSGVNLDEEAANLVKFQQSYQAAAQLITVVNSTFDALIGAVRS